MSTSEVSNKISSILVNEMDVSIEMSLDRNADLVNDLHINDVDLIEIVIAMEDEFNIEISDAEIESAKTVGDILELVTKKI